MQADFSLQFFQIMRQAVTEYINAWTFTPHPEADIQTAKNIQAQCDAAINQDISTHEKIAVEIIKLIIEDRKNFHITLKPENKDDRLWKQFQLAITKIYPHVEKNGPFFISDSAAYMLYGMQTSIVFDNHVADELNAEIAQLMFLLRGETMKNRMNLSTLLPFHYDFTALENCKKIGYTSLEILVCILQREFMSPYIDTVYSLFEELSIIDRERFVAAVPKGRNNIVRRNLEACVSKISLDYAFVVNLMGDDSETPTKSALMTSFPTSLLDSEKDEQGGENTTLLWEQLKQQNLANRLEVQNVRNSTCSLL